MDPNPVTVTRPTSAVPSSVLSTTAEALLTIVASVGSQISGQIRLGFRCIVFINILIVFVVVCFS